MSDIVVLDELSVDLELLRGFVSRKDTCIPVVLLVSTNKKLDLKALNHISTSCSHTNVLILVTLINLQ